jgi:hypothetical protein
LAIPLLCEAALEMASLVFLTTAGIYGDKYNNILLKLIYQELLLMASKNIF